MKKIIRRTVQKISAIVLLLPFSFAALATGVNGSDLKDSISLSSLDGFEISGLVALIICSLILLSAGWPKK
jgi:hypothetical protein